MVRLLLLAAWLFLAAAAGLTITCIVTQTPAIGHTASGMSVLAALSLFGSVRARRSRAEPPPRIPAR